MIIFIHGAANIEEYDLGRRSAKRRSEIGSCGSILLKRGKNAKAEERR
jgi:hypothetical protein